MSSAAPASPDKWRAEQRAALLEQRMDIASAQRGAWDAAIADNLYRVLVESGVRTVSLYWPFKGEFNSRDLMRRLFDDDIGVALPVVVEARAPLRFLRWYPDAPMTRGVYGIPIPQDTETVIPEAVVTPLVGFDAAGYRLGYGGGYYDRTLAALEPTPLAVGVGYELSRLETIHPARHDRPMSRIVTEAGVYES